MSIQYNLKTKIIAHGFIAGVFAILGQIAQKSSGDHRWILSIPNDLDLNHHILRCHHHRPHKSEQPGRHAPCRRGDVNLAKTHLSVLSLKSILINLTPATFN
jgi:hypothetical protein